MPELECHRFFWWVNVIYGNLYYTTPGTRQSWMYISCCIYRLRASSGHHHDGTVGWRRCSLLQVGGCLFLCHRGKLLKANCFTSVYLSVCSFVHNFYLFENVSNDIDVDWLVTLTQWPRMTPRPPGWAYSFTSSSFVVVCCIHIFRYIFPQMLNWYNAVSSQIFGIYWDYQNRCIKTI